MKILVIEDDKRVAGLLRRGLEEEGYDVTSAFDGATGLQLFVNNNFDLIITDIIMPGIGGIDLCREIRQKDQWIPLIMLTALGQTDDKLEGFDAGADDYLVKPFEIRELLARINALMKRNRTQKNNILNYFDLEMNIDLKTVRRGEEEIGLTPKEFKLLEYMMHNPERVLSRAEIAEKVWDTHFDTGTNFIDVYINYLRKKIDREPFEKLIQTRPGMGFVLLNGNKNQ